MQSVFLRLSRECTNTTQEYLSNAQKLDKKKVLTFATSPKKTSYVFYVVPAKD